MHARTHGHGHLSCDCPNLGHVRSFLGVPTPATPFPRHNEGVREMAMQIVRFILRNPLEVMGLRRYEHSGPLTFNAI